ncbi:uncharacterized protein LOC120132772 isoform X2 [Hibiscus syriacus]|uniref:uncharacterized protein LOC120132772 isoform X2 n=1 Tax=Hibiscus syriacus TaxID=106335 RepID=UPI001921A274|nr:uncharacterized protein LOC120132772 isoform X2 [Hibiscus syriacus]
MINILLHLPEGGKPPVPEPQTSHLPFDHFTDQEVHVNGSFSEGPQNSGSFAEQSFMLGTGDPFSSSYSGARLTEKSAVSGSENNVLEPVETTLDCGELQSRTHSMALLVLVAMACCAVMKLD